MEIPRGVFLAAVLCCNWLDVTLAQQPQPSAGLQIQVAVVIADVNVRPVPLFELMITRADAPADTFRTRTALDGAASVSLRAGAYRVRSVRPATVEARAYSWDVGVDVRTGAPTRLELTNANATVDSVTVQVASARQIAPEMALYERVRRGVLKVQAGVAHGTGFLIDTAGLIVTNDHVLDAAYGGDISVYLDQSTRVPAQILAVNHSADLAVVRINPALAASLPVLPLATPDSEGAIAVPGERVLAVGFPLTQRSTVTTGIVSGVREGAVMSDVTIDRGNSGGPMLNMAGQVIAVNTFGSGSGPGGIVGAVSVMRLADLLPRARDVASSTTPPSVERMPVMASITYPIERIRSIADTARDRNYRALEATTLGNFEVSFTTPVSRFVAYRQFADAMSRERRSREARAGLQGEESDAFMPTRDWMQYVGSETSPVVSLTVTPRTGETSGSFWGRALGAAFVGPTYRRRATIEFKGDVQAVRVYRNGVLVRPILGGRTEQQAFVDNSWISMRDVAFRGLYLLRPEVFAPDSAGTPPSIILVIQDLKHLYDENVWEMQPATVARIWNDFLPYASASGLSVASAVASAARFRSMWTGFCDTRNCWHGTQDNPLLASLRVIGGYDGQGVYVSHLSPRSPLFAAGLRQNRRITSVNGQQVRTWADFDRAVSASIDSLVIVTLEGGGRLATARVVRPR